MDVPDRDREEHAASFGKGLTEVVRFTHFARLSRLLVALAEAFSELPQIKDQQRTEARSIQEQGATLASSGGVNVGSAAFLESMRQQCTGTATLAVEVRRLSSEMASVQRLSASTSGELNQLSAAVEERLQKHGEQLVFCNKWQDGVEQLRRAHEAEFLSNSEGQRSHATIQESRHQAVEKRLEKLAEDLKTATTSSAEELLRLQQRTESVDHRVTEEQLRMEKSAREQAEKAHDLRREELLRWEQKLENEKSNLENKFQEAMTSHREFHVSKTGEHARLLRDLDDRVKWNHQNQEQTYRKVWEQIGTNRKDNDKQLECLREGFSIRLDGLRPWVESQNQELIRNATERLGEALANVETTIQQAAANAERNACTAAQDLVSDARNDLSQRIHELSAKLEACESTSKETLSTLETSVHAKLEQDVNRMSRSVGNVSATLEDVQANLDDGLTKLEKAQQNLSAATTEQANKLAHHCSDVGTQFERIFRETWEQASALRSEQQETAQSIRLDLCNSAKELRDKLEESQKQLAEQSKLIHLSQEAMSVACRDTANLRAEVSAESAAQTRRSAQLSDRFDDKIALSAAEMKEKLQAEADNVSELRQSLDVEVRKLLMDLEKRLRSAIESDYARVNDLQDRLDKMQGNHQHAMLAVQKIAEESRKPYPVAPESPAEKTVQRPNSGNDMLRSISDINIVVGSLGSAVMKIAQCCGIVGGLEERQYDGTDAANFPNHSHIESISMRQLLEWERSEAALAARIERSWLARTSGSTLLGFIQQKADAHALLSIQSWVRDVQGSICELRSISCCTPHVTQLTQKTYMRAGEPFVGPFGSQVHLRRAAAANGKSNADSDHTGVNLESVFSSQQRSRSEATATCEQCPSPESVLVAENLDGAPVYWPLPPNSASHTGSHPKPVDGHM